MICGLLIDNGYFLRNIRDVYLFGEFKGYGTFFDGLWLIMIGFDPSDGAGFRLKPDLRLRYLMMYLAIFDFWTRSWGFYREAIYT